METSPTRPPLSTGMELVFQFLSFTVFTSPIIRIDMKVYLICHTGSPNHHKMESWVDVDKVEPNGVYVKSVRAFLKKKEAKNWLKERKWTHLIIRSATINSPLTKQHTKE